MKRVYTLAELTSSQIFPRGPLSQLNVMGLNRSSAEGWAAQIQGGASLSEREILDSCLGSSLASYLHRLFEASAEKDQFASYTPKQLSDMLLCSRLDVSATKIKSEFLPMQLSMFITLYETP